MTTRFAPVVSLVVTAMALGSTFNGSPAASADDPVTLVKIPNKGVQPDVVLDTKNVLHLVYLTGEPGAADVHYVRSADFGRTFSSPLKVNSQTGSAIAAGTIRGAQLAVGRGGRVYVAWNGSGSAQPRGPLNPASKKPTAPMLYSRLEPGAAAFEPQRNVITKTFDLDGGGSIAADGDGNVYVAWHGNPVDGSAGEAARRVWIARSSDDGRTFAEERPVSEPSTGVCGCCALRLHASADGTLRLLYRAATTGIHRDIYALTSRDHGATFAGGRLDRWEINACPMTSMSLADAKQPLAAWETNGQVHFTGLGSKTSTAPALPAGEPPRRKHPRLAVGRDGTTMLVWTEGTAWARGGSLAWQAFDRDGRPTTVKGGRSGIPVWSFAAVVARPDGKFVTLY